MFILTCKNVTTNIYHHSQVDGVAKEIALQESAPVTVDQFEIYLGDTEPQHHIINTVYAGGL